MAGLRAQLAGVDPEVHPAQAEARQDEQQGDPDEHLGAVPQEHQVHVRQQDGKQEGAEQHRPGRGDGGQSLHGARVLASELVLHELLGDALVLRHVRDAVAVHHELRLVGRRALGALDAGACGNHGRALRQVLQRAGRYGLLERFSRAGLHTDRLPRVHGQDACPRHLLGVHAPVQEGGELDALIDATDPTLIVDAVVQLANVALRKCPGPEHAEAAEGHDEDDAARHIRAGVPGLQIELAMVLLGQLLVAAGVHGLGAERGWRPAMGEASGNPAANSPWRTT
mmetsp:Transcript_14168/g.42187  ORF Transcript_14168/g.42187 Transcript_14168/m.42187 type:complete len:283 (-) Transcript_14168:2-850(-)